MASENRSGYFCGIAHTSCWTDVWCSHFSSLIWSLMYCHQNIIISSSNYYSVTLWAFIYSVSCHAHYKFPRLSKKLNFFSYILFYTAHFKRFIKLNSLNKKNVKFFLGIPHFCRFPSVCSIVHIHVTQSSSTWSTVAWQWQTWNC